MCPPAPHARAPRSARALVGAVEVDRSRRVATGGLTPLALGRRWLLAFLRGVAGYVELRLMVAGVGVRDAAAVDSGAAAILGHAVQLLVRGNERARARGVSVSRDEIWLRS